VAMEDPVREPGAVVPPAVRAPNTRPRPIIERIGLAFIALVIAALLAVVGIAAFIGGEPFLGAMGALGSLMVVWVGGATLIRGK
jgi:hypothetical protein